MRYYFILLTLFIISCESNNQDSINQIRKVLAEQESAWNKGDIEGYMAGYIQSDSLRFASGGNVSFGWETTLKRYKNGYPDKATMGTLTFSNIDIELTSPEVAIVFGKWELDRENDHPWGLFTLIFRETKEGWRIVHDHTSSGD